jgi:hypothetical protein
MTHCNRYFTQSIKTETRTPVHGPKALKKLSQTFLIPDRNGCRFCFFPQRKRRFHFEFYFKSELATNKFNDSVGSFGFPALAGTLDALVGEI